MIKKWVQRISQKSDPTFKKQHLLPLHVPGILIFTTDLATLWERKGPQGRSLALSIVGRIACERNRIQTNTKGMDMPESTQLIKLKLA
jgi:hypothetical protein